MNPMNPMQILQMIQSSGNPTAMMQQMFGNHPMFQRAQMMLQGKTKEGQMEVLNNLCKQRGIDLGQLKAMFGLK
jgi:hypothetical protein